MTQWLAPQIMPLFDKIRDLCGPEEDTGISIAGIVFREDGPGIAAALGLDNAIVVILDLAAETDQDWALLELAHELTHCLVPSLEGRALMMEEGAAVMLSLTAPVFQTEEFGVQALTDLMEMPERGNYAEALSAVTALLKIDGAAIRKLRAAQPDWKTHTAELIRQVLPDVPEDLAAVLSEQREMHTPWMPSDWWHRQHPTCASPGA
ncbi:hypothetical protein [Methylobacterium sp. J-077]|uniref:hypothetical protein n=1 Tax=Methylobacterium sp. J-077 TaxID=2836656 RepID=UPI001FB9BCC9|nr:hypothetical protein [Methylobacterium sp. J-077]MCJ2121364.1 hypothetical protein [Methylobacterium sp. J-077]